MKILRTILACIFLFGQADFSLLHAQFISPVTSLPATTSLTLPIVNHFVDILPASLTYEPNFNQVKTLTDSKGGVTVNTYDYELPTNDPRYGTQGNLVKTEAPAVAGGTPTTYTYDNVSHLTSIKDALARTTAMTYDANENMITKKDPRLNTTTYVYDERDLLFKVTDANAGTTQYNYDLNGNLSEVIDAKANKTKYLYDGFNRKTKTTYADNTFEQYGYDKNSNVTSRITPNNQTITYVYDALNRSTAQTYTDSTMNIVNTYDLGSRLTRSQNSFSDVQVGYDKLNRVVSDKQIFGALTYEVVNQYDKAGNRTKATYPSGKVVDQLFNDIDQVTTLKVGGTNLANYTYDPLNRPTQKDLLGGATKSTIYTYDAVDQLLTLENKLAPSTLISKHTATYDKTGNRLTHANQQTAGTVNLTFVYSKINELTSVTGGQTHTYAYDKVGNRTNADGIAYITNTLNQYTKVAGVNHIYYNNGNLTQEPTVNYIYDAENRLLQMTKSGTVGQYRYDAFNRRISKDVGGNKIFYVHDGDDVIEERNTTGTLIADYVNGSRVDEILTMTRGGQTYYYFYDALGSVRQITNAAGTVVEAYDYDIFGKPLNTSAVGNPAMFTGRWFDAESGNYYYRARYYSPGLGKFLQRDPIGYFGGSNLYRYVGNNPVKFSDPSGLWGVQFGNFNIGVGNPTLLFGEGSGIYFGQTLAATADGFIPFFDPFKDNYDSCDKNLDISKGLGAFSRNAFIAAGTAWGAGELGLISKNVPIDNVIPNLADDFFRVGPKHDAIKFAREFIIKMGEQHKAIDVVKVGNKYQIINGHHTWAAVKQLGRKVIEIKLPRRW